MTPYTERRLAGHYDAPKDEKASGYMMAKKPTEKKASAKPATSKKQP